MASLRRIASLDRSTPHTSSNPDTPTHCLVRHSSLPHHFFCQPEFSMRALSRTSSLNRTCHKTSPYSIDPSSLHSCNLSSNHSLCSRELPILCRALSSHGLDHESTDLNKAAADAHNFSTVLPTTTCAQRASHVTCAASRKESVGLQRLDMEESVVYSELRQSMWRFEAPPRFLMHGDIEGTACGMHTHAHIHTHHHEATDDKEQNTQNPVFSGSDIDKRGTPLSLRMLKRKMSKGTPQASSSNPCKLVAKNNASQAPPNFCNKPRIFMDVGDTASHVNLDIKPQICTDVGNTAFGANFNKPRFFEDGGDSLTSAKLDKPQVFTGGGDSVCSAFASLVYMMRMLQHHTYSVHMRFRASTDGFDQSWHETASASCRSGYADMIDSFLWLFQQVFSCTPKLMLLTMILLADFTLHSMSRHVAFPAMPLGGPPTAKRFPFNVENSIFMEGMAMSDINIEDMDFAASTKDGSEDKYKLPISSSKHGEQLLDEGGVFANGGNARVVSREGGHTSDGDDRGHPSHSRTITEDTNSGIASSAPLSSASLHHVHQKLDYYTREDTGIDLDQTTKHMLVAPVHAPVLEADDYPCFDRTHLTYQHEISVDPANPLLLANYAHFLHVVRHDHARAEELYRRAVRADDEVDSEVMGRFANFLWVAKGDLAEADTVYQAAMVADPTNAFHAGSYAHFLWNVGAEETSCCVIDDDNKRDDNMIITS